MPRFIIEICPHEPRASICTMDGLPVSCDPVLNAHVMDCTASGDCQPACEYVRDVIGVEFRIVARNAAGEYESRLATAAEKAATARAIYFESESDFDDEPTAETYLIWDSANGVEGESWA